MDKTYKKYKGLSLNSSLICLEPGEITTAYFCYPTNAQVIGFEGCILYCFLPEYGNMVFASNPQSCADKYVYPLAKDFTDFLRMILSCGSANPIEQIVYLGKEGFEQHLKQEPEGQTKEQKAALDLLRAEFDITPMENPFEYVKSIQADFDDRKIRFGDDYNDALGIER